MSGAPTKEAPTRYAHLGPGRAVRLFEEKRVREGRVERGCLLPDGGLGREVICWSGVHRTEVAVSTLRV